MEWRNSATESMLPPLIGATNVEVRPLWMCTFRQYISRVIDETMKRWLMAMRVRPVGVPGV